MSSFAAAPRGRGKASHEKGNFERAIAAYTETLRIYSRYVGALNDFAWLLATCRVEKFRNGPRAVELRKTALELACKAESLDALAAAYAEIEDFRKAIEIQERAIALGRNVAKPQDMSAYTKRLKSYRARTVWRE